MTPICVREGSFSGPLIYDNKQFVSPNQVRSDLRRRGAMKHSARQEQDLERGHKKERLGIRSSGKRAERDALDKRELFA